MRARGSRISPRTQRFPWTRRSRVLYYSTRNPATGMLQRKVTFVKRVVAYGLPILVGSGYYHPDEGP